MHQVKKEGETGLYSGTGRMKKGKGCFAVDRETEEAMGEFCWNEIESGQNKRTLNVKTKGTLNKREWARKGERK